MKTKEEEDKRKQKDLNLNQYKNQTCFQTKKEGL